MKNRLQSFARTSVSLVYCGRSCTRVDYEQCLLFLSPSKRARHEYGLTKSEEKGRLLAVYTRRTREAGPKRARGVMGRRDSPLPSLPFLTLLPLIAPLFNRIPRDSWGQISATSGHSTANETKGVTWLAGSPSFPDQRFSI